ncbi:MAG: chemotaxis-specific protein-glutamate methyltransferase CheB [Wujia sp.]
MKKILLLDDSALMRRVMSDIINSIIGYEVAYTASNGKDGLLLLQNNHDIDVVMTDIDMPKMDGLELLRQAKQREINLPFIVFSSKHDAYSVLTALDLGAIEFIKKPEHILSKAEQKKYADKIQKALFMAVQAASKHSPAENIETVKKPLRKHQDGRRTGRKKLVALVCSTGGPRALQSVIPRLPANLAAPVVLVQHMPEGFTNTLAMRLNEQSKIRVKEAEEGDYLKNGVVYIAKGGTHLAVRETPDGCEVFFDDKPAIGGLKPCGNIMLSSLCNVSYDEIICVILTGMGADGTKGTMELSECKEVYVIAQDEETSTVYGMPRAVYEAGLCDCVCSLEHIADEIIKKVGVQ